MQGYSNRGENHPWSLTTWQGSKPRFGAHGVGNRGQDRVFVLDCQ
jgi:hypothetical protein